MRLAKRCTVLAMLAVAVIPAAAGAQYSFDQPGDVFRESSLEVRRSLLEDLAKFKRNAVPFLLPLLKDPDASIRRGAVEILAKVATSAEFDALIGAVGDSDKEVRIAAIDALGKLHARCAYQSLILATNDPDDIVRGKAIVALAQADASSAAPIVARAAVDQNQMIRIAAAKAIENRWLSLNAGVVERLMADEPLVRKTTVRSLHERQDPAALPFVIPLLEDPDAESRDLAARAVSSLATRNEVPVLIRMAGSGDADVRAEAVHRLGDYSDEQKAAAVLVKATADPDVFIADRAAWSIAKRKDGGDLVLSLLHSPNAQTRAVAAAQAGEVANGKKAILRLRQLLDDPSAFVTDGAAQALGDLAAKEALPDLLRLLERGAVPVPTHWIGGEIDRRVTIIRALARMGDASVVSAVAPLVKDSDENVAREAIEGLESLGGSKAIAAVGEALQDPRADVRYSAVEAFAGLAKSDAIPLLRARLDDAGERVAAAAADKLAELGDAAAAPHILRQLPNFTTPSHRATAASALVRLGDRSGSEELRSMLRSGSFIAREVATDALVAAGDAAAGPAITEALSAEFDPRPRLRLIRALITLRHTDGATAAYKSLERQPDEQIFRELRDAPWFTTEPDLVKRVGDTSIMGGGEYLLALRDRDRQKTQSQLEHARNAARDAAQMSRGLTVAALTLQAQAEIRLARPRDALATLDRAEVLARDLSWPERLRAGDLPSEWIAYWRGVAHQSIGGDEDRRTAGRILQTLVDSLDLQHQATKSGFRSARVLDAMARTNLSAVQRALSEKNLERAVQQGRGLDAANIVEFENEQERLSELARFRLRSDATHVPDPAAAQALIEERALRRMQFELRGEQLKFDDPEKQRMVDEYRRQVYKLEILQTRLNALLRDSSASPKDIAATDQQIAVQRGNLHDILVTLANKYPDVSALIAAKPIDLTAFQAVLPSNVALLQFVVLPKHLLIVVVRHDGVWSSVPIIDDNDLRTTALDFISAIASEAGHPRNLRLVVTTATRSSKETGRILYSTLIEPVRHLLNGIDIIGIVPSSFLYVVPFAALEDSGGQYLGQDFSIFYVNTVSRLWATIILSQASSKPALVAIGNPDESLKAARREVETIKKHYSTSNVLIGPSATKKATVATFDETNHIVHFATHGMLDADDGRRSYLKLADGQLTVREVWDLNMKNVSMATLSACDTAVGEVLSGSDVINLEEAFFGHGCGSVVATLWRVDDDASADLMIAFYQHLSENHPKALALRMALDDIREKYPTKPYFWAGFTLHGNWR